MSRKSKKHILSRVVKRRVANVILGELDDEQFTIFPSTQAEINQILKRAIRQGRLESEKDVAIAAAALISAAAEEALRSGTREVTAKHLTSGWYRRLAMGGTCPPHRCVRDSVLKRQEALKKLMPRFRKLHEKL